MRLFTCCCGWSYVLGKRRVYGAIYPDLLSNSQRMMTRKQFEDLYADCAACAAGQHKHGAAGSAVECGPGEPRARQRQGVAPG